MIATLKPLAEMGVCDVMSRNVIMIPEQMSLPGAARILSRAQVTGAPVVDGEGRCVGVLSATDYLHLAEHPEHRPHASAATECQCKPWQIFESEPDAEPLVRDVMNRDPVLVAAITSLREVARQMLDAHIHRVVVVDGAGRPIGIVSSTDILAAVARSEAPRAGGPVAPSPTFAKAGGP